MSEFQDSVDAVKNYLRAAILRAELPEGAAVHEDLLRTETGASTRAVKKALQDLAREGLIHRKRHVGTQISEKLPSVICAVLPPVRNVAILSSYSEPILTTHSFTAPVIAGIRELMQPPALISMLTNPVGEDKSLDDLPHVDEQILKPKIQGLISIEANHSGVLNNLVRAGLPSVAIEFAVPDGIFDMVYMDHLQHGFLVTWHLLEMGHRRIAFVGEKPTAHGNDPSWQERLAGYLKAMTIHGGRSPQMWILGGKRGTKHIEKDLAEFHREFAPSAYVLASGFLAPACFEVLQEMGLAIPRDVSLAAADNALNGLQSVPMTRVLIDFSELGRAAIRMLATRLACRPMPQMRSVLQGRLVPGDTAAPPAPGKVIT